MRLHQNDIFNINSAEEFKSLALEVFKYQYRNNSIYREFCDHLNRTEISVNKLTEIPFLPISFFKSSDVITTKFEPKIIFTSSGTTSSTTSKHYIKNLNLYQESYRKAFENFYGPITDYCILALLPSYLERQGSSLVYMIDDLIKKTNHIDSGFYLNDYNELHKKLIQLEAQGTKTLLIGVSFALLDLVEKFRFNLKNTFVMETGGMKGQRKEIIREELHQVLAQGFGLSKIHSEYGMTELLSQAYSSGDGIFKSPPWMKIMTRDTEDPLRLTENEKTGGLNIIDLANIHSCSFIATQDLGKVYKDGSFEILGRFDNSDIRGCNLMVI